MNKILRRRLAALAVVAVAAPLLFAGVAGALPDAHGAPPAAPAVGAPGGAGTMAPGAGPDACPRGLSAAQADRQARQLASQSASHGASQITPQSNCCPHCDPNPPPTTQPTSCSLFAWPPTLGNVNDVGAEGEVACNRSVVSISLIVTLEKKQSDGTWKEIARDSTTKPNTGSAKVRASTACAAGTNTYRGVALATYNKPPSQTLPKKFSAERTFTC